MERERALSEIFRQLWN